MALPTVGSRKLVSEVRRLSAKLMRRTNVVFQQPLCFPVYSHLFLFPFLLPTDSVRLGVRHEHSRRNRKETVDRYSFWIFLISDDASRGGESPAMRIVAART